MIAPHFAAGVLKPDELRRIADLCEQFPEAKIRLSGDLIIGGIADPARQEAALQRLGLPTYDVAGNAIRPIKVCSGGYTCANNVQASFPLATKLDQRFAGRPMPFKLLISVAGCGRCCTEPKVRDIGVVATKTGYAIYVGGAAGAKPRLAQKIADNLSEPEVIGCLERIAAVYQQKGKFPERLGAFIEKLGVEQFLALCSLKPLST